MDGQNISLLNKLIKKNITLKDLYNIGEQNLNKEIIIENDVELQTKNNIHHNTWLHSVGEIISYYVIIFFK